MCLSSFWRLLWGAHLCSGQSKAFPHKAGEPASDTPLRDGALCTRACTAILVEFHSCQMWRNTVCGEGLRICSQHKNQSRTCHSWELQSQSFWVLVHQTSSYTTIDFPPPLSSFLMLWCMEQPFPPETPCDICWNICFICYSVKYPLKKALKQTTQEKSICTFYT